MKIRYFRIMIYRNVFLMLFFILFISVGYSLFNTTIYINGSATSGPFIAENKLLISTLLLASPRYTSGVDPTGYAFQSESLAENNLYTYLNVKVSTAQNQYSSTQTRSFKLSNAYNASLQQGSIVIQNQQNTNYLNVTTLSCAVTSNTGFVCPDGYICSECPGCDEGPPCAIGYHCAYDGPDELCVNDYCVSCEGEPGCPTDDGSCPANYECINLSGICQKCSNSFDCPADEFCLSGYQYVDSINTDSFDNLFSYKLMWLNDTNFDQMKFSNLVNQYEDIKATKMSVSDIVNPGDDVTCDVTYYTNPYGHTAAVGNVTSVIKLSYLVDGTTQNYYYNIVLVP